MKESELIKTLFSALNIRDSKIKDEILEFSTIEYLSKNSQIIKQNQFVKFLIIVLDGRIRVWHEHNERELTLYHVENFETCVFSIVAIENQLQSLVNAQIQCDTTILKVPIRFVMKWKKYPSFNQFMFNTLIRKYDQLLNCIKLLAFKKIDERVIYYLIEESKRKKTKELNTSHNEIAKNIGTTREVVSKSLKTYENNGRIELAFKKIKLL